MVEATTSPAPQANGKLVGRAGGKRNIVPKRRGFFRWTLSLIARLATWAAILTIVFRCPASLEDCDETSPRICRPYFQVKNVVIPRVEPYYNRYAAPYVEIAQPYYNTLQTSVLTPAKDYAVYYGAPWVKKGQDYVLHQWELNGQPRLAQAQAAAAAHHNKYLAPHLDHAGQILGPYYNTVREGAESATEKYGVPAYEFAKPFAIKGYDASYQIAVTTVVPAANWAWIKSNTFLDTAVWPQLRVVYVENVEPQLVRIGERLGRYRSKARLRVLREKTSTLDSQLKTTKATVSSQSTQQQQQQQQEQQTEQHTQQTQQKHSSSPAPTMTTEEVEPEAEPTMEIELENENTIEVSEDPAETAPEDEEEAKAEAAQRTKAEEMVAADLELWQNKFATQAEEGAADIEDRVDHIARGMMENNVMAAGKDLVTALESTTALEVQTLKQKISLIITEGSGKDQEEMMEQAIAAIRATGLVIKKKAQAVRAWRQDYDQHLQNTILSMADVHFQILDETRTLALQQIGMKWAWTEGITYRDWAKYHDLKSTFTEWTEELKQLIVTHPSLISAQEASAQVEDEAMAVASDAAQDLAKLKEVSKWKIAEGDASDEFDLQTLIQAAEDKQKALEAAEAARIAAEEEAIRAAAIAEEKAKAEAKAQAEAQAKAQAEAEAAKVEIPEAPEGQFWEGTQKETGDDNIVSEDSQKFKPADYKAIREMFAEENGSDGKSDKESTYAAEQNKQEAESGFLADAVLVDPIPSDSEQKAEAVIAEPEAEAEDEKQPDTIQDGGADAMPSLEVEEQTATADFDQEKPTALVQESQNDEPAKASDETIDEEITEATDDVKAEAVKLSEINQQGRQYNTQPIVHEQ